MFIDLFFSFLGKAGRKIKDAANDNSGIGVVEVILILVEILTHRYMYI